jgi:hypothetical protein
MSREITRGGNVSGPALCRAKSVMRCSRNRRLPERGNGAAVIERPLPSLSFWKTKFRAVAAILGAWLRESVALGSTTLGSREGKSWPIQSWKV